MRSLLVGAAALFALALSAAARCAELMHPVPQASSTTNAFDWSGFYVGGQTGYAWGRSNFTATSVDTRALPLNGSLG